MSMVPTPAVLWSVPQSAPMALWGVSCDQWSGDKTTQAWLHDMLAPAQSRPLQCSSPFLEHAWGMAGKKNPHSWQDTEQCLQSFTWWGRRNGQTQAGVLGLTGQPWKECECGIGGKKMWEWGMWLDLSEWAKSGTMFVFHENVHQKVSSAKEDFNNRIDRLSHSASPRGLWTKWPWSLGWRSCLGSVTWTSTH
jgi:hypothetical protein